jgi:hypothetical protein
MVSPARSSTTPGAVTVSVVPSARVTPTEPEATLYVSTPERMVASWVPSWKCSGSFAPGSITTRWRIISWPGALTGAVWPQIVRRIGSRSSVAADTASAPVTSTIDAIAKAANGRVRLAGRGCMAAKSIGTPSRSRVRRLREPRRR